MFCRGWVNCSVEQCATELTFLVTCESCEGHLVRLFIKISKINWLCRLCRHSQPGCDMITRRYFVTMEPNVMREVEITIKLPEQLVERARAVGLTIEDQVETITDAVEKEIVRREAGQRQLKFDKSQLAAMAADPEIRREISLIQAE